LEATAGSGAGDPARPSRQTIGAACWRRR